MKLRTILIVDDSPMMFSMLNIILLQHREQGVTLRHALNGQDAISLLEKTFDVDLIFLDLNMPVMTGMQFLEHAATHSSLARIPTIVTSSDGDSASVEKALRAGARGYLKKPFQKEDCLAMIEKIFLKKAG